jgi:hypothetical protein
MPSTNPCFRTLAVVLCCLVINAARPASWAQQTPGAAPQLVITILDGEGALNDIRQRTAREPIIEVQDENHKPVAGAVVSFTLPSSGPSGAFADGSQIFSTVTDDAGRAVAQGLRPNNISGQYDVHIRVTYNNSTAETTIHQKNVSGSSSGSEQQASQGSTTGGTVAAATHGLSVKTILIIAGSIAAAGTVAGVLATRGGSSTNITAGTPTVGAPPPTAGISIRLNLHGR